MNTKHIHDLTFRLCQGLDQNYDVINMDAVLSVISTLEGTTITKEQLEATRLAKFINHLRRRTKDEHLARRAKSLLKKWREMVGIQQQQQQPVTSSAALPSVSGLNTTIYQQQCLRSQSISPAASSVHFDTLQQHSNSSSSQAIVVSVAASAITESIPRVRSVTPVSLASIYAGSANVNVHTNSKRLGGIECQNEVAESGLKSASVTHLRKQLTSFENVLSGFGVTDNSNIGITSDNTSFRHKFNKPLQQRIVLPDNTEAFVIDQSSNSNSESLVVPSSSRPSNIAPIVIDIQDSNSGSNSVIPMLTNPTVCSKLSSTRPDKVESANVLTNPGKSIAASPSSSSKSKKLKKEKKRKDKGGCNVYSGADNVDGSKNTVLLDETSSNQQRRPRSSETVDKFTPFVNEDKSHLAYPEILSLLDNSSLGTMFPPDGSINPVDEQIKVNLSTSNSSRSSFNLSTSDLTFAGKFKQGNAVSSAASSNDLIAYNAHRCTASPKTAPANSFLQTGSTTSKFMPFRDVGSNSNDSSSNSRASQTDLIDVISNDKMLHTFQSQRKQDSSNSQQKSIGIANISTSQTILTPVFFPQKIPPSIIKDSNATVSPEKKIPRKRGRKKGSKGIDSIIAKETSLSSQMLKTSLGSGSKKVKTTKELYAEMQNRKLGITITSSPTLATWPVPQQQHQTSRPTSSCSEPSLQSPHTFDACSTNATMSTVATRSTPENFLTNTRADETTSDTVTSEPSRDSFAIPKDPKRSLSIDSNSNSQLISSVKMSAIPPSAGEMQCCDGVNQIAVVEKQLADILRNLPPVPNIAAIELKCTAELLPCTCKITEISPESTGLQESDENQESEIESVEVVPEHNTVQNTSGAQTCDRSSEGTGGNIGAPSSNQITEISLGTPPSLLNRPKLQKSIFDLDFDEDDDPLVTLKAEAAAATLKKEGMEENLKMEAESELLITEASVHEVEQLQPFYYKMSIDHPLPQTMTETMPVPLFPTYEVEEDPLCVAKQRFDIQTQQITKFHIDALHNCFIANVNGNWDNANSTIAHNTTLEEVISAADAEIGYIVTDGCNVVPKYGSLVKERIRKDLSQVMFSKNYKFNREATVMDQLYVKPFLGVAHSVLKNNKSGKTHNHKTCHKTKLTALNNCVYNIIKRTEEYKTDEQRICVGVLSKDNHTDLTPETCNRTGDTEGFTSNIFTDTSQKSINPDARLSIQKHFDLATCAIVGKNNNNVTLKDITIDVVSHGTDLFLRDSNELTESAQNGQNLLAIADHLNYNSKPGSKSSIVPILSNLANTSRENDTIDTQIISNDQQQYTIESGPIDVLLSDISYKRVKNICLDKSLFETNNENDVPSVNMDENLSSRRSSSGSNSSLLQTQHSINVKLRRQFQEQKLLDVNAERKRRHKRFGRGYSSDNKDGGQCSKENKKRRVKRIKIAINGEFATQMQVPCGSSNTSSDDDNGVEPIDFCTVNEEKDTDDGDEEIIANEENSLAVSMAFESENVGSFNSAGSVSTIRNPLILANEDYELDANFADNNYNDEQEIDDYRDPNMDAEVEFDEYEDAEDYSGDFHEVVTRDISAPSAGNNHIVITIKKTPSKTNSPSNSLSAMSPVIVSNNTIGCQTSEIIISPVISRASALVGISGGDIDMNALIVNKLDIGDSANTESSLSEIQSQSLSHVQTKINDLNDIKNSDIISPKQTFKYDYSESLESVPPLEIAPDIFFYKEYQKQRSRHKIKEAGNDATERTRDTKLHHELFFPHELIVSDNDGFKQSVLNMSSCSSSCAENSDYDNNECVTVDAFCEPIFRLSTSSPSGMKLETKDFESCATNSDISVLPQQKLSSLASSCSTLSNCSTCEMLMECQVIPESYTGNDFGDPSPQAADLEIKSGRDYDPLKNDYEGKRECEGNGLNSESLPIVNAPHSDEDNSQMLADTTDIKLGDNLNEEFALENNGLLYSFNNIYYTVDTLSVQTNDITVNSGNIIESKDGHLMFDSVVVGSAAVDAVKQQEQKDPNKNCDDYNNLCNKNSNINLIRYYNNEPSLVTDVYLNKQSGSNIEVDQQQKVNYLNTGDDYNADSDVYFINDEIEQLIVGDENNEIAINIGSTHAEHKTNNADIRFNICGNYGKKNARSLSMQSRAQVMLPHKEYRTGLRAVDEDVNDDDGNNCARIQEFKEWHQVLQLSSYNDELLTVLPYVVLD